MAKKNETDPLALQLTLNFEFITATYQSAAQAETAIKTDMAPESYSKKMNNGLVIADFKTSSIVRYFEDTATIRIREQAVRRIVSSRIFALKKKTHG